MKFLIIFALALASSASAGELQQRNVVMPVIEIEGRITNGNNAVEGEFRYQVGLSLKASFLSTSWCGGSLISDQWVLTAAHCTDGIKTITVYLGATIRTAAEVTYTVTKDNVLIHGGWNRKTLKNDISLIKIPSVEYSAKIHPVTLPTIVDSSFTYDGDYVIASGWGRISDEINGVTKSLQWARMQVISNAVCAKTYGSSIITDSHICISTINAVSTCSGDSGGPLVLEPSKVQIGLTSFGAKAGCEKGYPAVFTRLTSYLPWIYANTGIPYYVFF